MSDLSRKTPRLFVTRPYGDYSVSLVVIQFDEWRHRQNKHKGKPPLLVTGGCLFGKTYWTYATMFTHKVTTLPYIESFWGVHRFL